MRRKQFIWKTAKGLSCNIWRLTYVAKHTLAVFDGQGGDHTLVPCCTFMLIVHVSWSLVWCYISDVLGTALIYQWLVYINKWSTRLVSSNHESLWSQESWSSVIARVMKLCDLKSVLLCVGQVEKQCGLEQLQMWTSVGVAAGEAMPCVCLWQTPGIYKALQIAAGWIMYHVQFMCCDLFGWRNPV